MKTTSMWFTTFVGAARLPVVFSLLVLLMLTTCQSTSFNSPDRTTVQFIEKNGAWVQHTANYNQKANVQSTGPGDDARHYGNRKEFISKVDRSNTDDRPSSSKLNRKLNNNKVVKPFMQKQIPAWKLAGLESASLTLENIDRVPNNYYHHSRRRNNCPVDCRCGVITGVTCNSPNTEALLPPSFPRGIQLLTLYGYKKIKNELENLSYLQELSIYDGNLPQMPKLPRSLTHLRITNSKLPNLDDINTLPNLHSLKAPHNNLSEVNLSGLTRLLSLDLSNNPLIKVPELPPSLTILKLRNTHLSEQPLTWSTYLPNLKQLTLTGVQMIQPPNLHLPMLEYLDFSYSKIKLLPYLTGLPNLKELDLSHTAIFHAIADHFKGPAKLRMVNLSHTNLSKIPDQLFINNPNIEELYLHDTDIQYIKDYTLSGLGKLEKLILRDNPNLTNMDDKSLSTLTSLKILDISNTAIKVLPHSLTNVNISSLTVENITILCDCHSYWLTSYIDSLNDYTRETLGLFPAKCSDGITRTATELQDHINNQDCLAPDILSDPDTTMRRRPGQTALLECNATGIPSPIVFWQSPAKKYYTYNRTDIKSWFSEKFKNIIYNITDENTEPAINPRIRPLKSGQLLIQNVTRDDVGFYRCTAVNSVSSVTTRTSLWLTADELVAFKYETMLFGLACAMTFFLTTLIVQLVRFIMDRMGWECCCCRGRIASKAHQVKKLLESVESYKTQQLERLKDNYNSQVVSIKESCYQQMERLSESYTQQSKNLQNLKDYSAQQITTARDQYVEQINKVRDYSLSQMNKVSENYVFQRQRVRKFSAHQLFKLRETYKYQQKTFNKILENIPDLYLQNCRTGGNCNRADSIIFDDEIHGIDAYYRLDFLNPIIISNDGSEDFYYTPSSTLTRGHRQYLVQQHRREHSNTSADTTDYQEAVQSWATTTPNQSPGNSPSHIGGVHQNHPIKHTRSLSISAAAKPNYSKTPTHRRTMSATVAVVSSTPPAKVHKQSPTMVEKIYWTPQQGSPSDSYHNIANNPALDSTSKGESDNSDCESASMLNGDDEVRLPSPNPNSYLNNSRYLKLAAEPIDKYDMSFIDCKHYASSLEKVKDDLDIRNGPNDEKEKDYTNLKDTSIPPTIDRDKTDKTPESLDMPKIYNQTNNLTKSDSDLNENNSDDTIEIKQTDETKNEEEQASKIYTISNPESNSSASLSAKWELNRKKSISREGSKEMEVRIALPSVSEDKEPLPSESHL